jgi:hypothetical protein
MGRWRALVEDEPVEATFGLVHLPSIAQVVGTAIHELRAGVDRVWS